MADIFLQSIKEIERRSKDNVLIFSDVLTERLTELAQTMIDARMSDNDYIKLCEVYWLYYKKENNVQGMLFCLLRIQQLIQYKKKTRFQFLFPSLTFSNQLDTDTRSFLLEKKYEYKIRYHQFKKKLAVIDMILMILLLYILILVFHISFFRGWFFTVWIGFGIYFIATFYIFDRILESSIESLRKNIHPIHAKVDISIQKEQ